jgi:GxxExxY protein
MGENKSDLLYEDLSYQIRGAAYDVRKNYGPGHKEVLYQRAFDEELNLRKIKYVREKPIKIYSPMTGKIIGSYQPDS